MTNAFNKLIVLLCVAALSVSVVFMTACDPGKYYYDLENLRASVKAIELINYDNPDQKDFSSWVQDHTDDLKPLKTSAIQIRSTLDGNRIDEFMLDLSQQQILYKYFAYNSPKDICIRIIYEDNCFDIVSCNDKSFLGYIGTFSPSGEVIDFTGCFCGYFSFEYLLQKYFNVQTEKVCSSS